MTIKERRTKPTQKNNKKSVCGNTTYTLKRDVNTKKNTRGAATGTDVYILKTRDCNAGKI